LEEHSALLSKGQGYRRSYLARTSVIILCTTTPLERFVNKHYYYPRSAMSRFFKGPLPPMKPEGDSSKAGPSRPKTFRTPNIVAGNVGYEKGDILIFTKTPTVINSHGDQERADTFFTVDNVRAVLYTTEDGNVNLNTVKTVVLIKHALNHGVEGVTQEAYVANTHELVDFLNNCQELNANSPRFNTNEYKFLRLLQIKRAATTVAFDYVSNERIRWEQSQIPHIEQL
jgi:hypothetical protein